MDKGLHDFYQFCRKLKAAKTEDEASATLMEYGNTDQEAANYLALMCSPFYKCPIDLDFELNTKKNQQRMEIKRLGA